MARKQAAEERMPLRLAWKLLTGVSVFEKVEGQAKSPKAAERRKKRRKMQKESRRRNR